MSTGLSVSRLVNVTINLSPQAVARRTFGTLLALGDSSVINAVERIRFYTGLEGVATDFGTSEPEYLAAQAYFGQSPKPKSFAAGRWVRVASAAFIKGGTLTTAEKLLSAWTPITSGGFKVTVDGVLKSLTGLDFSGAASLNAIAALITAASSGFVCTYNGSQFIITSSTTGASSTVTYAIAPVSGTDISAQLKLTSALASTPIPGFAAEEPVAAIAALVNASSNWYGLAFAASVMPNNTQIGVNAAFVEALTLSRVYGVTETDARCLDSTYTSDIPTLLKNGGYLKSFDQYSENIYAVCSFFGRAFSVDFSANNSTITMMYKQEPSITPQTLTETQATTLKNKRCNVYVLYDNDTSILQYGVMAGAAYFDEIFGTDWLQNAVQTACYNLLYTSTTKIPQTDAGTNQLVNAINGVFGEGINNGLGAPGVWNADGFGTLNRGDYLKTGFYVYAQPMALQSQSDREQRIAPPITCAFKLAGAIQEVNVVINVNR